MVEDTIQRVVQELKAERDRLDRAIQALESGISGGGNTKTARNGRKPMSAAQRKAVSLRMSRYWKKRRAEKAKADRKNGARKTA